MNEQLAAKGYPTINGLNTHEARHLPDGNLLLLGAREIVSTSAQGGTPAKPVDIIGDLVLVLDHNLQLVWAWDSFAHEDINRAATLNDQATPFSPDFTTANDWLHTNFAQGTADGNIILSQRSQDWVIKINYANGAGDGSVIWHMGAGDDFTLLNPPTGASCGTPNVFPWFTHQHDTAFQFEENSSDGGGTIMTVYDDGNTRFADCPAPQHSRGMVLFVDESARQVYMETAGDLGVFSEALGSGQLLAPGEGNLYASYDSGIGNAQSTEIDLAGQIVYQLQANSSNSYRAYRMPNLYGPTFSFTATGVYVQTATPLQFVTIPGGATEVLPLTITNFGLPGTVTVATSVTTANYKVLTTAQNTCLAGITAGQSCTLPVQFNPTAVGVQNDTLTITPSAGPAPANVALNGTAVALQISAISPNYGAPAALISIAGTNFGATQGNGFVTVGGAFSRVVSWSNTLISIAVPSNATTGNIVVTAGGASSNGAAFTFYPFPALTGVSPSSGPSGTPVTITGSGLLDAQGNATVAFNGVPALISSDTGGSILATVPAAATTGPVTVRINGVALKTSSSFTVTNPLISSISPSYGAPAALIGITGTNFGATQGNGFVTVGGAFSRVVSWSNTLISITVPSNATTGNIVVTVGEASSNGAAFAFYPYPAITGIAPAGGGIGTLVTITGSGLLDGKGNAAVTFNGTPATILSQSTTSIQVAVPAGATTGPVSVFVNGNTIKSSSLFTVVPPPQISGLSPNYGAPAAVINITGSNFGATQGSSYVIVGDAFSEVTAWSNTAITIRVPSRASTGNLVVNVGGATSNGAPFTFYPYPAISSVSPGSGSVGTLVTITGSNLLDGGNNATVTFNGIPAPISSDTSGSIQVTVPTGATSGRILVRVNGVTLIAVSDFIITP